MKLNITIKSDGATIEICDEKQHTVVQRLVEGKVANNNGKRHAVNCVVCGSPLPKYKMKFCSIKCRNWAWRKKWNEKYRAEKSEKMAEQPVAITVN